MTERDQAAQAEGAGDLEILHPERVLEIAGVKVTMREYGFVEGMRLAGTAAPVVHDLASIGGADLEGGMLQYARLQAVFSQHVDAVTAMVAQACDQSVAWVQGLDDADGQALLLAWWAANGPFFVRRVLLELQMRLAGMASAGASSMPPSPPPATAPSNNSGGARSVN